MDNTLNLRVRHTGVIVEPFEAEDKSAGGIIIPDSAKAKPQRGTVITAGPGTKDDPMDLEPGDNVMFRRMAGTKITVDGKDYLLMEEADVLAVFGQSKV